MKFQFKKGNEVGYATVQLNKYGFHTAEFDVKGYTFTGYWELKIDTSENERIAFGCYYSDASGVTYKFSSNSPIPMPGPNVIDTYKYMNKGFLNSEFKGFDDLAKE